MTIQSLSCTPVSGIGFEYLKVLINVIEQFLQVPEYQFLFLLELYQHGWCKIKRNAPAKLPFDK